MSNLNHMSSASLVSLLAMVIDEYVMSEDEVRILALIEEGHSYREIAVIFGGEVSHQWVATRARAALRKKRQLQRFAHLAEAEPVHS